MLRSNRFAALLTSLSFVVAAGCSTADSVSPTENSSLHVSTASSKKAQSATTPAELAKVVHAQTARFHSLKQAEKAGYVQASPCIAIPVGGMGFHYNNDALIDDVFDPMNPEAILYAPDKNGKLRLVAVEYIVMNEGQAAPTFAGQAFDVDAVPELGPNFSLHVWVHKSNPLGMFAPFNPDVSCP